jgi:hypothetical protein
MPDATDVNKLQEQIFDLVKRSQEALLDASRVFTDRVSAMAPGDPAQLDDLIDNAFDMTERVMRSQRELAKKVVETVTAQIPGADHGGEKSGEESGGA